MINFFAPKYVVLKKYCMKLTLGFSPCPNDTFIFDALIHHKIDTEGLEFEVIMEDVEALNQRAFNQELDVTKLSYHAFAFLVEKYALLNSGSALGNGVGPLLIAKNKNVENVINQSVIAIPGKYTTANFLFSLAYPEAKNKQEIVFHDIEAAILRGSVDAGVIIHENRFTYQERGFVKILDLGEFWESTTGLPIPLGGIVINRKFPVEIQQKMDRVLQKSVRYAQTRNRRCARVRPDIVRFSKRSTRDSASLRRFRLRRANRLTSVT